MSLASALSIAKQGLQVSQRGLDITASNVANVDTPGYTRKVSTPQSSYASTFSLGVREGELERSVSEILHQQYFKAATLTSGHQITSAQLERLNAAFGAPGSEHSLNGVFSAFTSALESLSTTPNDETVRRDVLNNAESLAAYLRSLSQTVQDLRQESEDRIGENVDALNTALEELETINRSVVEQTLNNVAPVNLLDRRDVLIGEISEHIGVRVRYGENNGIALYSDSGVTLLDQTASRLEFDGRSTITTQSLWSDDSSQRSVGTITLNSLSRHDADLIENGAFREGAIKAHLDLRDNILPQVQEHLDALAATLSSALSNYTQEGTQVTSGAQEGYDLDLSNLKTGNAFELTYTDTLTGNEQVVSFIRVDDPASLPLDDTATGRRDDTVYGIDFSGASGTVAAQIAATLGGGFSVNDLGANTLQILDDGAAGGIDISNLQAAITADTPEENPYGLSLFVDKTAGESTPFTNSLDNTNQQAGFASRIHVNGALTSDPGGLVRYSSTTGESDTTRPRALADGLRNATFFYQSTSTLETRGLTFEGTVGDYLSQVIGHSSSLAEQASREEAISEVKFEDLTQSIRDISQVDIETEMARLIELRNLYAANARVFSITDEMLQLLFRL